MDGKGIKLDGYPVQYPDTEFNIPPDILPNSRFDTYIWKNIRPYISGRPDTEVDIRIVTQ